MIWLFVVVGIVVDVSARRLSRTRPAATLATTGVIYALLALGSLVFLRPSPSVSATEQVVVGIVAAVLLFAATRVFVIFAGRWRPFARAVSETYAVRGDLPPVGAAFLVASIAVAEEIFWRGLVQSRLSSATSGAVGAIVTWVLYVGVNVANANIVFLAGAAVGGAVWGGLAAWSGGVLAAAVCHALWSALMVAVPPRVAV